MNNEAMRSFGLGVCALLAGSAACAVDVHPLLDMRVRDEYVSQQGVPEDANAETFRVRSGVEIGRFDDTSLLAEGTFTFPLNHRYRPDSSVPRYTQYPVVSDPENYSFNRLQLTNTSLPKTTLILGRQRIGLDDQRFIGTSSWRQTEQTFDALRAVVKPGDFTIDLTYSNEIHRGTGKDSPQGAYKGHMAFGNVAYALGPVGKLIGFAYLMDFDPLPLAGTLNPVNASNSTYGGRFVGARPLVQDVSFGYILSYATQHERGSNPRQFSNDYYLAELSLTMHRFTLGVGNEILNGNGTVGFMTPIATLHRVQGWADKFQTTPANGIDDRYGTLVWSSPLGKLDNLSLTAAYHTYEARIGSAGYGDEWNGMLTAKRGRYQLLLEYADYRQGVSTPSTIARDTKKFWTQLEYVW